MGTGVLWEYIVLTLENSGRNTDRPGNAKPVVEEGITRF